MKTKSLLAFLLLLSITVFSENPILHGYADPHMKVWNGKMYLFVGKDKSPELKGFVMPYWSIYSSSDLVNWTKETDIKPEDTYLGAGFNYCWAGDITTRNGKYYVYFSNHAFETGVLVADKPNGPYVDVLKGPLLPANMSVNREYDATAFIDDDGQQYLQYGRHGILDKKDTVYYQLVKLNKDNISLAEKPHDLKTIPTLGFGVSADDHGYFHKHNGIYYLSCANVYYTSTNIYGPFTNKRQTGATPGHASFGDYNGQSYHCWEFTDENYKVRSYRQVMLTYLHYKDNGDMIDDTTFTQKGRYYKNGVGQYCASWNKIEAEWFFKISGSAQKRECPTGGFEIQRIKNGDYLNFPNMKELSANATIHFRVSSENLNGATIEIRKDSEKGEILGTCNVPSTGSWKTYKTVSCKLKNKDGTANLYFVFKGKGNELMRLDWFNFGK